MNKIYFALFSFVLIVFFASCAKKMDEELIPSYIYIENIEILTNNLQGSSSSYITDAWFYVDGADRGAYTLPATIPYLGEGKHTIKVAPGIKLNGVSSTRVPYPLVEPKTVDLELFKDSIIHLNVNCNYYSTTEFALIEDFEDLSNSFDTWETNTAEWRFTSKNSDPDSYVFEGNHSGGAFMDNDASNLVIVTKQVFDQLPKNGIPVFVEMNFRSNTTVTMAMTGINGEQNSQDIIFLNPTEGEWKKIYINLTSTLSYDTNGSKYRIWFYANHTNGDIETYFMMDNFKLLYRNINE